VNVNVNVNVSSTVDVVVDDPMSRRVWDEQLEPLAPGFEVEEVRRSLVAVGHAARLMP
jgi:hypothetical protein